MTKHDFMTPVSVAAMVAVAVLWVMTAHFGMYPPSVQVLGLLGGLGFAFWAGRMQVARLSEWMQLDVAHETIAKLTDQQRVLERALRQDDR